MLGESIDSFVREIENIFYKYQQSKSLAFLDFTERCFFVPILLIYNVGGEESIRKCYMDIQNVAHKFGGYVQRASIDTMPLVVGGEKSFWKVAQEIKKTLDPDNIISPGRYII